MLINKTRVTLLKEKSERYDSDVKITNPRTVYRLASDMFDLDNEAVEKFMVIALDNKHRVITCTLSSGTVNASLVSLRALFQWLLLNNAVNFVLVHNHPSGDVEPSNEDKAVTTKVLEASNIMDLTLLDHIIVGDSYFSFKENGLI